MKSMFFRLFASFITTILTSLMLFLFITSTVHNVAFTTIREKKPQGMAESFARIMVLSGRAAQNMYLSGGQPLYEQHIDELASITGTDLKLYDQNNISLSGDNLPEEFKPLVAQARKNKKEIIAFWQDDKINIARSLRDNQGNEHILVGIHAMGVPPAISGASDVPFAAKIMIFLRESNKSLKILLAMLVSTTVCYFLARSLTAPILELRRMTQLFAEGNYTTRITGNLRGGSSEITDLGKDFNIMAEKIETVISAQKRLLRDISHELRSPLARQKVALELIRQNSGMTSDGALAQIEKEAGRMNDLITQLLTLNQIDSGEISLAMEDINLSQLIVTIVNDARFEATCLNCNIQCQELLNVTVHGNMELLRRAIENVIRNAIHYTGKQSEIQVNTELRDDLSIITVRDYGPGVPQESLSALFEPFYRVEQARDRFSGGVGLGLAIAQQALLLHDGSITANNWDHGLEIQIVLPISTQKKKPQV